MAKYETDSRKHIPIPLSAKVAAIRNSKKMKMKKMVVVGELFFPHTHWRRLNN